CTLSRTFAISIPGVDSPFRTALVPITGTAVCKNWHSLGDRAVPGIVVRLLLLPVLRNYRNGDGCMAGCVASRIIPGRDAPARSFFRCVYSYGPYCMRAIDPGAIL